MTEPVHTFAADPRNEFDRPYILDRLEVLYDLMVEQYDDESEDYNPHAAAVTQAQHAALLQEAIDTGLIEPQRASRGGPHG